MTLHTKILRHLAGHDNMSARQVFEGTHSNSYNSLRNALTRLNMDGKVEVDKDSKPHAYSITGAGKDYLRLKVSPLLPFYLKVLPYLMDKTQTEAELFATLDGYYSQVYFSHCLQSMRKKGYIACENGVLSVTEEAISELGLGVLRGCKP